MDKDVIVIESSDDEDAPPKKQPKTGGLPASVVSLIKGTTVTKVKSPTNKPGPMYTLGFNLDSSKKKDHAPEKSARVATTVDLTSVTSPNNKNSLVISRPMKISAANEVPIISTAIKRPLSLLKLSAIPSPSTSSAALKAPPAASAINEKSPISIRKSPLTAKPTKRITPRKLSSTVSMRASSLEKSSDSDGGSHEALDTLGNGRTESPSTADGHEGREPVTTPRKADAMPKTPLNEEFKLLVEACQSADKSVDMQRLIDNKLVKYYQGVHHTFVNSKSFRKTVSEATRSIQAKPNLVYVAVKGLLEELKTRRDNSKIVVIDDPDPHPNESLTGDDKKDLKVRKLSAALNKLKRKIAKLEEAEVDFEDEVNSKYMISERCKKRAWVIYEKICDLTGESKDAQRLVKKPIRFKESPYIEFNRTLEQFVNKTNSFPDMFDVLKCMQHCNKKFGYRLTVEECKNHAKEAFIQVGRKLQKRRKSDLYEMVSYYTRDGKDPALEDQMLKVKLEENQKFNNRQMKAIIDKFAFHQDNKTEGDDMPEAEPGTSLAPTTNSTPVKMEASDLDGPSTSNTLNTSAITLSSGGRTPPKSPNNIFDDDLLIPDDNQIDLMDVSKFENPMTLDDEMDFPLEITNVMSIDGFNFGA